ncbi:lysine-specific demethylase 8-like [Amphibalanus amphitrite]|uniref:lysine-specific demethylase 8-like n=1 Tax=Amphibalanus amphitrite TaxID=1232801 RepID=UPI001C92197D|nr:lysine-specific demethylase 8-like [Amphibalanus amphitrite]XP_043238147.1 lysine-specific demethylase 8-like [Amphibalanus amphitrite]
MVSKLLELLPSLPCTSEAIQISEEELDKIGNGAFKIFCKARENYIIMLAQVDSPFPSMAKALSERCWEELNTSHWAEVPHVWRVLYSYAALFRSTYHLNLYLQSSHSNVQAVKDALYYCDMGLIMGKPVLDNLLTKVASCCHQELTSCIQNTLTHPASTAAVCDELASRSDACPPISEPVPRLPCPSVERFVREVFGRRPAVLAGCVSHWPALRWTLAGLERTAGHRTVPVELGGRYTDAGWSQRLMTLGQFIEQHVRRPAAGAPPGYLAQYELFEQIPELGADVPTPEYCWVGAGDAVHTNIWLGPAGTVSPLHHDPKHNCLVQVLGRKFVQVFAPEETPRLYPHEAALLHNTSRVDAERPDLEQFPAFAGARHQEVELGPGDLLYMPPGWWHYVRSLSVSCSVSFWFE